MKITKKEKIMEEMIQISHLSKAFKEIKAVSDLSFSVRKGELFAFLGENGAGKSTTISILCGQLSKDSGHIEINGTDLDENLDQIKRDLGVVFQNSGLDKALNVTDNLKSRAALYGIYGDAFEKRLKELATALDFMDLLKRPIGKLSGGQRRKIDIARALLHEPKILILDEPTTGLDPQTRQTLWRFITNLRQNNQLTVLLTTHYMEEAAEADYVVILEQGQIVVEGTPLQLKNQYTGDSITLYHISEEQVQLLGIPYQEVRDGYRLLVKDTKQATDLIIRYPHLFIDYEIIKGKMDDVFLAVTGKTLMKGEVE